MFDMKDVTRLEIWEEEWEQVIRRNTASREDYSDMKFQPPTQTGVTH